MSIFDGVKSRCEKHQRKIVSEDKKSPCKHTLNNVGRVNAVRQYKLDKDVFPGEVCCDFLVLNDTLKKAYFIELKGRDFVHGIEQLKAAEDSLQSELKGFQKMFRLIHTRSLVHKLRPSKINKTISGWNKNFIEHTMQYEESC